MARRANELYIGNEYLTIEGRQIKHPALISCYATPTVKSKIRAEPIQLLGLDLETEPHTAELKLGILLKYSILSSLIASRMIKRSLTGIGLIRLCFISNYC